MQIETVLIKSDFVNCAQFLVFDGLHLLYI